MEMMLALSEPSDELFAAVIGWVVGGFVVAWLVIFFIRMLWDFWKDED